MTAATLKHTYHSNPWLRRLGKFSFMFFFLKGLMWLIAPLVFYHFI